MALRDRDRGKGTDMKIALLAGSNRIGATSTKLLRYLGRRLEERGLEIASFDLRDKPLLFYSEDAEDEHPHARLLLETIREADGLVLATPEYHGSLSGTLKNALDHLGSKEVGGKPVLSVSSAGGDVGVGSLTQLQAVVRNLHGINCPDWLSIGGQERRFDEDGRPAGDKTRARAERALDTFVALTVALRKERVT